MFRVFILPNCVLMCIFLTLMGYAVEQLVEALGFKLEDRDLDLLFIVDALWQMQHRRYQKDKIGKCH